MILLVCIVVNGRSVVDVKDHNVRIASGIVWNANIRALERE